MKKYSEDLRQKVKNHIANGGTIKEAIKIFGVARTTIYRWLNSINQIKKSRTSYKVNEEALAEEIGDGNDIILRELAKKFNVQISTIWYALKRLGFSKKRSHVTRRNVYTKEEDISNN